MAGLVLTPATAGIAIQAVQVALEAAKLGEAVGAAELVTSTIIATST